MRIFKLSLGLSILLALIACGKPLPPERVAYAGEWRNETTYLLITRDGSIQYKRIKQGTTVSINAPIQDFEGNDFNVGVGPVTTKFVVSKPPYQEGDKWKMVVDDATLVKTAE